MKVTHTTTNSAARMTLTGLFAAMITLMTAYICHIPYGANGGYIHFGDALIYIAAVLLPRPYALAAAAIGGGLADLLTAPMWAPATIIIKMLIYKSEYKNSEHAKYHCSVFSARYFCNRILSCRRYPVWIISLAACIHFRQRYSIRRKRGSFLPPCRSTGKNTFKNQIRTLTDKWDIQEIMKG